MNKYTVILLIFCSLFSFSQAKQTHTPASKSLKGIWRQTGIENPVNGKVVDILSGNYKVINEDGTFYTFVTWNMRDPFKGTTIGQYGDYQIKSDSTLIEHIVKHVINPSYDGKDVELKYELIDESTMMMAWWNLDKEVWVSERWTRLPLSR